MALGHISLICLAIRFGFMPIKSAMAATGRMALTNYLTHSVFALTFFILAGQYAKYSLIELYMIMLAIWTGQILFSKYWMERHNQGPMEGLWRWLTYGSQGKTPEKPSPTPAE